jgi:hypothetical protein
MMQRAKVLNADDDVADTQDAAFPFTLLQSGNTADHNIGSKATAIATELCNRAVRRHQKGKHIESMQTLVAQ